jgi:DNA replication licensing factor MCM7
LSQNNLGSMYKDHKLKLVSFLREHSVNSGSISLPTSFPYIEQLSGIKDRDWANVSRAITVSLADLRAWGEEGRKIAERAQGNAVRYHEIFCLAVDHILADEQQPLPTTLAPGQAPRKDVLDILADQRAELILAGEAAAAADAARAGGAGIENDAANDDARGGLVNEDALPPALMRRYELRLQPAPGAAELYSLRHIRAASIGKLVVVRGMITRCSDVKPHCDVCTYECDECGYEIYQETRGRAFNP